MQKPRYILATLFLALALGSSAFADTRDVEGWMKSSNFIVGVYNVEDLIQIPGTPWILGSGLTTLGPGMDDPWKTKNYIHVFDARTETGYAVQGEDIALKPAPNTYPDTSTPPDWEKLCTHGIALGATNGNNIRFYAVTHGREAVEVFDIDFSGERLHFTWIGTILAPIDGFIDAVAWIPGTDGVVVTSLLDPRYPEAEGEKQMKGEPVGWVREWFPEKGWTNLRGTEPFSSDNGIVVSADGKYVYIAASATMNIHRITREGDDPELVSTQLDGIPDNIRWSEDGKSLLVGVHTAPVEEFVAAQMTAAKSGGNQLTPFNITRLDPETLKAETVMPNGVYGALGAATGAIEVGNRLWVSTTKADRIGIFDLNP